MLESGTIAPAFTLPDAAGNPVSLLDFYGKTVVLYFYSKDGTGGCTRQAQAFRDAYDGFLKKGVVVIGISRDTSAAHKKFIEQNNLPFILLSDTELTVLKAYDVWKEKNMYGKKVWGTVRTTYVITPEGTIQRVFPKVKPDTNAAEILDYLKSE
ncbi:MAG: thioredoxin-dependent thiol peroxidase [Eubacteriales bacterium]